ncbi:hypothetical protein Daesc_009701 [Daldinia eschscholtzii]|uniref:Uncharacterized protein n=1 Tax=Daldinia eschscholtzii TaxID=292717 RepID=A0AAX6MAB1_9PEZI
MVTRAVMDLELLIRDSAFNGRQQALLRRYIRSTSMAHCPQVKWNERPVKLGSNILSYEELETSDELKADQICSSAEGVLVQIAASISLASEKMTSV